MTPPFCHSANTPCVSGAAAMSGGVNGKLWNLIDISVFPRDGEINGTRDCVLRCRRRMIFSGEGMPQLWKGETGNGFRVRCSSGREADLVFVNERAFAVLLKPAAAMVTVELDPASCGPRPRRAPTIIRSP